MNEQDYAYLEGMTASEYEEYDAVMKMAFNESPFIKFYNWIKNILTLIK